MLFYVQYNPAIILRDLTCDDYDGDGSVNVVHACDDYGWLCVVCACRVRVCNECFFERVCRNFKQYPGYDLFFTVRQ